MEKIKEILEILNTKGLNAALDVAEAMGAEFDEFEPSPSGAPKRVTIYLSDCQIDIDIYDNDLVATAWCS